MERENVVDRRKGDSDGGSGPSHTYLYNELLSTAQGALWWNWRYDEEILVETKAAGHEDRLGQLGKHVQVQAKRRYQVLEPISL